MKKVKKLSLTDLVLYGLVFVARRNFLHWVV